MTTETMTADKHWLILYVKSSGTLLCCTEYDDGAEAMDARFRVERLHPVAGDLEIVVLSAGSLDALRRTHGRYFASERPPHHCHAGCEHDPGSGHTAPGYANNH